MNLARFISNRTYSTQGKAFSRFVSQIAVASVALCIASVIVAYSILKGFQKEIKEKLFSFGSHLVVTKYDLNESFESSPINTFTPFYLAPNFQNIDHIQRFAYKAALFKTKGEVNGVLLKGVDKNFYTAQFKRNIVKGFMPLYNDTSENSGIVLSQRLADKLELDTGSSVLVYFIQNPPRYRKLVVKGLYETGLEELDNTYVMCDLKMLQKINNWSDSLAGGFELYVKDFDKLELAEQEVYDKMDYDLKISSIKDKFIHLFDWINMLDNNVVMLSVIILFVACFNMVSTLFVLIMERTNMIGMLKALGANNSLIQRIFVLQGMRLVLKGLLWGNLIGIAICFVQYHFHLVPLDPDHYYMSHVPIQWEWTIYVCVNLFLVTILFLVLYIPAYLISSLRPVKAIRFD
jgi:lipoprotein-releasing system permease protein